MDGASWFRTSFTLPVAPKTFLAAPLGVDFGQARIGLAVCPGGLMSVPLEILVTRRRPWLDLATELIKTAKQHGDKMQHHPMLDDVVENVDM